MLVGSEVFVSSRIVCSTKKSFIRDALSASSVKTMSSFTKQNGCGMICFDEMLIT